MTISEAKDKLWKQLRKHEVINGCGIGVNDTITVFGVNETAEKLVPKYFEGYEVILKIVGIIRAL